MSFAERFPRDSKGWIKFPTLDGEIRKQLFPEEVMKHPAKINLYMLQAIIDYLYKPGDLILDPMAGTGSIMISALSGCQVVCIDCSEGYYELLQHGRASFLAAKPDANITVLHGDCLDFLPLPVDHICFSPPYTSILAKSSVTEKDLSPYLLVSPGMTGEDLVKYSSGKGNVGLLSEFFHMQALEKVFKLCYDSLTNGTMTIITKDHIEAGRRAPLTRKYIKAAERVGFKLVEAFKWHTHGTGFTAIYKSKGIPMVEDEDISIMKRGS